MKITSTKCEEKKLKTSWEYKTKVLKHIYLILYVVWQNSSTTCENKNSKYKNTNTEAEQQRFEYEPQKNINHKHAQNVKTLRNGFETQRQCVQTENSY